MDVFELHQKIPQQIFDYQKLMAATSELSHARRFVGTLIKKEHLIRLKKGLYLWGEKIDPTPYSKEIIANLMYGPSYISLETALAFHGLIPERVEMMTSVTPKKNKHFESPVGDFSYEYLNSEAYSMGICLHVIEKKKSFLIAAPEKALLDLIALRKLSIEGSLKSFIENDLRIDWKSFKSMDQKAIQEMGQLYKSRNVKNFISEISRG